MQKVRFLNLRERACNFFLGFRTIGPSDFFGPRSKVVLRNEGLPMPLFTWLFPHMAPIFVSQILRVHGSSRHKPGSKNLQNKQGTDGGVMVVSPMLKLVKEIESVLTVSLASVYFSHSFFLALPSLFIMNDDDPLFMRSG